MFKVTFCFGWCSQCEENTKILKDIQEKINRLERAVMDAEDVARLRDELRRTAERLESVAKEPTIPL